MTKAYFKTTFATYLLFSLVAHSLLLLIVICASLNQRQKDSPLGGGGGGSGLGGSNALFVDFINDGIISNITGIASDVKGIEFRKRLETRSLKKKREKKILASRAFEGIGSAGKGLGEGSGTGFGTGSGVGTGDGSSLGPGSGTSDGSSRVLAEIKRRIELAKRYPALAKRMGQEGRPEIVFKINRDGSIEYARLVKSTGIKTLDDAAVETVYRAAPLPFYERPIQLAIKFVLK